MTSADLSLTITFCTLIISVAVVRAIRWWALRGKDDPEDTP